MLLRRPLCWIPDFARPRTALRGQVPWPDVRVDALIDTYVEWREECEAVERAYERWSGCEPAGRRLAYAAYCAALDREEKAAAVYELAAMQLAGAAGEPLEC